MHVSESRIIEMALGALEEVAAHCHVEPVKRSKALAVVLAFLASRQPCNRHAFDLFWRAIQHPRPQDRWGQVNAALNGIYAAAGRRRNMDVVSQQESRARARLND